MDTLRVPPCKLRGGIHAAKRPATVDGQRPVALVGVQGFKAADNQRRGVLGFSTNHPPAAWYGVLATCGTVDGRDAAIEP
ncbi:hypothetical protein XANMN_10420 [Xanthomonas phaseoli pv. manihotis str. CIO151]|nr:hypothetical protein XANMN_10420 [Xanthomonas phaseoli pv. manihotis str. CIO151]